MKFGFRRPSLNKRIAACTSWKRVVRHSPGLKAPRGWGWLTNPKKALCRALRHTMATRLASSGAPLVQAQQILGHSDPKLTARVYSHLGVEDLRGAVERLQVTGTGETREARSP